MSTRPLTELLYSHPSSGLAVLQSRSGWEMYLYKQNLSLRRTRGVLSTRKLKWVAASGNPTFIWMFSHPRGIRRCLAQKMLVKLSYTVPEAIKAPEVALRRLQYFDPQFQEYVFRRGNSPDLLLIFLEAKSGVR
jgi:hypothetical protein